MQQRPPWRASSRRARSMFRRAPRFGYTWLGFGVRARHAGSPAPRRSYPAPMRGAGRR